MSIPPQLHQPLKQLIRANHILHYHGLVDAFGHISIRHPLNPQQYLIAAYDPGAPALITSAADFLAYHVSDSSPVDPSAPQGYSERFIHGEIFSRHPGVNCVVHSHSEAVIPFTVGGVDVKPVFHMAGFLGSEVLPVFNAEDVYKVTPGAHEPDMLIKNAVLGRALAMCVTEDVSVVLQHKHGFTTYGASIEEAVYRAVYTHKNCLILAMALEMAGGDASKVSYLTAEEARACAVMNRRTQDKAFRLWLREVQASPVYANEEGEPEKGEVGGMKM